MNASLLFFSIVSICTFYFWMYFLTPNPNNNKNLIWQCSFSIIKKCYGQNTSSQTEADIFIANWQLHGLYSPETHLTSKHSSLWVHFNPKFCQQREHEGFDINNSVRGSKHVEGMRQWRRWEKIHLIGKESHNKHGSVT